MENWKQIEGFKNYMVSDLGNVKSVDHETFGSATNQHVSYTRKFKGRLLKPGKNSAGYFVVRLSNEGKLKLFNIHKLVAHAFLGPCPEGKEVDHRNGNQLDNRSENLQYLTHKENDRKGKNTKLSQAQVNEIRKKYSTGKFSQRQLGKEFNVSFRNIGFICNNKRWT
jgi:hypothetical protein